MLFVIGEADHFAQKERRSHYRSILAALVTVTAVVMVFSLVSCSAAKPIPRYTKPTAASRPLEPLKNVLPDGWADITGRSQLPHIQLWIVNRDYSATIVVKELQANESTQQLLLQEDICFAGNISLRAKLADGSPDKRVTRTPMIIDAQKQLCSYVYAEKGLLRRVVVYRKNNAMFEVELLQENSSAGFDELTNDQLNLVNTLLSR